MREIKFRAWDETENRFWYFTLQEVLERRMEHRGSFDEKILRGDKQEFTGLYDRNNKPVYEGDLIVIDTYSYEVCEDRVEGVVEYSDALCCFGLSDGECGFDLICNTQGSYTTIVEVVGNIYENPEMVE